MQYKIRNSCIALLAALAISAIAQQSIPPFQTTYGQMGGVKLLCIATSGNGSAYTCNTTPIYTPIGNQTTIELEPDVANNSGGVTLAVNGGPAYSISTVGTTSSATDPPAGSMTPLTPVFMTLQYSSGAATYYWAAPSLAASGGGGGGSPGSPSGSGQYNNGGSFAGNGVYLYAAAFSGADWVAKTEACEAAVETASGGTCDAQSLAGGSSSSTFTVGDGVHTVIVLLGPGTYTANNFLYHSYGQLLATGPAVTVGSAATTLVCSQTTAANNCVAGYPQSNAILGAILKGFQIKPSSPSTQFDGSVGLLTSGGVSTADVEKSKFINLWVNGFDTGTLLESLGGCECYNIFDDVNDTGQTLVSVRTLNLSGYPFGINSNHWTGGDQWGPIGLWDTNGLGNTWDGVMDFEHNTSTTGAILYARPVPTQNGTGYAVNDTVRPTSGGSGAVFTVTSISGGGGTGPVTGLTITAPGAGYSNAIYQNNTESATTALTGSGTGLYVEQIVEASRLLLNYAGGKIDDAYIEDSGGQEDFLCGTQYDIKWAKPGYSGARCAGFPTAAGVTAFGQGDSSYVEGSGGVPSSLGLSSGTQAPTVPGYVAFHQSTPFDPLLFINNSGQPWTFPPYYPTGIADEVNIFPNGPAWNGTASQFTILGPAPWVVGESTITSGQQAQGLQKLSQIPQPSAPNVVSTCTGSCSTSYTFYVVGFDSLGGETVPSAGTTISNGPATLSGSNYITVTPPWPTNVSVGPLQYGIVCWAVLVGTTSTAVKNNSVGTCPNYQFTGFSLVDNGQGTVSFTPLSRTTTGDIQIAGFLQLNTGLAFTDAGTCAMSTGTSCTHTVPAGSGNCTAVVQGSTPIAAACGISGTTATVTAASSNSDTWLVISTQ